MIGILNYGSLSGYTVYRFNNVARKTTVLTRRFGGDYLAEGSANCAAINLIFNYFRQHVISGSTASESDSDLSDAEVDDELHSNGNASEDEEEDAALAAAFAEAAGALRPIQSK